uniref:Uncharacterized protein n=1 Tax=Rhizophora mucronata TaxID=61149 RepID=A0A2P2Q8E5_RHIMU
MNSFLDSTKVDLLLLTDHNSPQSYLSDTLPIRRIGCS